MSARCVLTRRGGGRLAGAAVQLEQYQALHGAASAAHAERKASELAVKLEQEEQHRTLARSSRPDPSSRPPSASLPSSCEMKYRSHPI